MPNSVKYKTGNLTGSISTGNVALGVNESVLGPTETTGWYNGLTPSPSQYVIYEVAESGVPKIYQPSDDTQLIQFARSKGATGANTGSVASVLNWATSQANIMISNNAYPSIVTDGLILNSDARFTPSYPTTGTTWYDISGNNKNGTLINGPLFDSNRGAISFDGINETVSYGTGNTFFPLPSFSIELTFQSKGTVPTTGTSPGLFGFTFGIRLQVGTTSLSYQISSGSTAGAYPLSTNDNINYRDGGRWYTVVCQTDATSSQIYVNGQFKNSRSLIWSGSTVWPTNGWSLGRDNNNPNQFFTGSVSNLKIYNKILSQAEINQNYYQAPIVTDGLVFAADAGNLVSYESGSATMYSLTGSSSGSLVNGVGYSSGNGGSWGFDGVDNYILGNSNLGISGDAAFTIMYFARWDGATFSANFPSGVGNNSTGISNTGLSTTWQNGRIALDFWVNRFRANTALSVQTWYYVAFTKSPGLIGSTSKLYVNGQEVPGLVEGTNTTPNITDSPFVIGRLDATRWFNGKIPTVQIYNKTLTATEVSQNFNAQRSRFGI